MSTRKSKTRLFHRSPSVSGIGFSSSPNQTANINLVRLLLLVISLASTCSLAQDINTNTVTQEKGLLAPAQKPSIVKTDRKPLAAPKKYVDYICPNYNLAGLALIFSVPCKTNADCNFLGPDQRCCKLICRKGMIAPPKEPKHRAVLGVNRMCPKVPVPEILPVKSCLSDIDCEEEGRVCCPDKDLKLYCRMAAPVWSQLPFPRAHAPVMSVLEYMQCQPAPPAVLDLFPQRCNRTIECLPNLCCQEGPSKFCRPAKKSVIALLAQMTQAFTRG